MTAVGKPVVLVLMNGSAAAINWAHDHVPTILESWYPAQAGGRAIADNAGGHDGDEVVQSYLTAPVRTLAGFRRIALKAKERRTAEFTLPPARLRGAGSYEISVGGGQPGYLATGVVSRSFRVPQP